MVATLDQLFVMEQSMSSFTVALMVESPPVLVFYTSTACGATVPHCARNRTGLFACVSKLANWVRQSQRPSADEYFPSLCWLVHQIIPIDVMLVQVPIASAQHRLAARRTLRPRISGHSQGHAPVTTRLFRKSFCTHCPAMIRARYCP